MSTTPYAFMAWYLKKHTYEFACNFIYGGACLLQVMWDGDQYGPIFNDTFLRAVFGLQEQIQKVQLISTDKV
jgi:hypothetical protein